MLLLDAVDADTDGDSNEIHSGYRAGRADVRSCFVWATSFGGGTVTIQVTPDNGTNWFPARTSDGIQATFTQSDMRNIYVRGTHIRAVLNGATSPSDLSVKVV